MAATQPGRDGRKKERRRLRKEEGEGSTLPECNTVVLVRGKTNTHNISSATALSTYNAFNPHTQCHSQSEHYSVSHRTG